MMESINAFFSRRTEPAPVTIPSSASDRNHSEATTVVEDATTVIEEPKDISTEEDDVGVNSLDVEGSSGRSLLSRRFRFFRRSTSSLSPPSDRYTATGECRDPFEGGVEGGVTYRSMKWWYVHFFRPEESLI